MDLFTLATDRDIKRFVRAFSTYTRKCEQLMNLKSLGHDEDLFGFSVNSAWLAYNTGITPEEYAAGRRAFVKQAEAANTGGTLNVN